MAKTAQAGNAGDRADGKLPGPVSLGMEGVSGIYLPGVLTDQLGPRCAELKTSLKQRG